MLKRLLTPVVAAAFVLTAYAAPKATQAEPIILKGTTPWIADYSLSQPFFMLQKLVTERLKGKLVISYLGGAEVIPPFEQFEALRNRTVDVILGVAAYYTGQIPEASAILLARKSPSELRKNGYYDIMRDLHAKAGVVYLSNVGGSPGKGFRMYSKAKITSLDDFKGKKFRVSPVYVPLVRALGGVPVNMKPSDVYTALERGTVDGYGWAYLGVKDFGWYEVSKYVIDHPFYSLDTSILFNKQVWEGLPADVRAELEKIGADLEVAVEKRREEENAKEDKLLKSVGMEFVKFSDSAAKTYVEAAYTERWKKLMSKSPELGKRIRALSE